MSTQPPLQVSRMASGKPCLQPQCHHNQQGAGVKENEGPAGSSAHTAISMLQASAVPL